MGWTQELKTQVTLDYKWLNERTSGIQGLGISSDTSSPPVLLVARGPDIIPLTRPPCSPVAEPGALSRGQVHLFLEWGSPQVVEVTEKIGPKSASKLSPSSHNSEGKGDFGARVYLAVGKPHNGLISWSKPSSTLTSQNPYPCGITHSPRWEAWPQVEAQEMHLCL